MNPMILADNRLADGVVSASTTATGYSALHLVDWKEFTYWKAAAAGGATISVDCGVAKAADAVGIAMHNLAAAGASVSVECSDDDFVSITVAMAAEPVTRTGVFFKQFPALTKRYWRLSITGATSPCYIAIAAIGQALVFDQPLSGDYTPQIIEPEREANISAEGHLLGVVSGITMQRSRWTFDRLHDDWLRANLLPLWSNHLKYRRPVFLAPTLAAHPEDVYLMRLEASAGFAAPVMRGKRRRVELEWQGGAAGVVTYNWPVAITWDSNAVSVSGDWRHGAWSSSLGLFVIVGRSGRVATSSDGVNWVAKTISPIKHWERVIWVDSLGLFVAVCLGDALVNNNGVMTSSDGVDWILRATPGSNYDVWWDIDYSPALGLLVAVGTSASTPVITSSDGINWTGISAPWPLLRGVSWSPDVEKFVALEELGGVIESSNGVTWTRRSAPNTAVSVCWAGGGVGRYIGVCDDDPEKIDSSDGTTWTAGQIFSADLQDVLWINEAGRVYACGRHFDSGPHGAIYSSGDGSNWRLESSIPSDGLYWRGLVWSPVLSMALAVGISAVLVGRG